MMIGWYEKCKGSLSIDVLDKYIAAEPFIFSTPNHGYAIRQSVKLGSNERKQ